MDTVFGSEGESMAKEDQERQIEIYRRLGLVGPDGSDEKVHEKGNTEHTERA
jgi:hypothetical protein